MPELHIKLKIPFECESSVRVAPALEFFRWLPSGNEKAICVEDKNMRISLWFDETCVSQTSKDYLKCPQLCARNINADALISDVSQEFATYMQQPGQNEERETSFLQPEYQLLGKSIRG